MSLIDDNDDSLSRSNTYVAESISTEMCSSSFPSMSDCAISSHMSDDECGDTIDHTAEKQRTALLFNNNAKNESYESSNYSEQTPPKQYCAYIQLVFGIISLLLGILTVHYDLYEFVLNERMRMTPGLPPYNLWITPTPNITMRLYIFTVENAEAFLAGTDDKLKLKEIGPIVYREHLHHSDVVINNNSTLSYTPKRWLEFLPEQNEEGILNKTIMVPNFSLLAAASSINDAIFIKKIGFNAFFNRNKEDIFLNTTVYQYLWNYTSPVLQKIKALFPFMVPVDNTGVLYQIYKSSDDRFNVRIGPKYGADDFFNIQTINEASTVPRYNIENGDCDATIVNASEGAFYNTRLTHASVIWYWRKAICRPAPLYFSHEVQKGSLLAYKYDLHADVYDRLNDSAKDCYKGLFHHLPDGLTDVSKCYYDIPLAASNPHFYGRRPKRVSDRIEGLHPNKEKHGSFIIVEPITGIPINQCARSQSNVITPKFSGFAHDIDIFSDMAIPTFWAEYCLKELTPDITNLIIFTVHIVPIISIIITILFLIGGLACVLNTINRLYWRRPSEYVNVPATSSRRLSRRLTRTNTGIIFANPTLQTDEKELKKSLFA